MLEWLKRHAWKACNRQNRFGGSNPPHSAKKEAIRKITDCLFFYYSNRSLDLSVSWSFAVIVSIFNWDINSSISEGSENTQYIF